MPRGGRNDVFVGNIAFGTTDEDIRQIFSEVGNVRNVRMAVNAETGKPRGYCFVEYRRPSGKIASCPVLQEDDARMPTLQTSAETVFVSPRCESV